MSESTYESMLSDTRDRLRAFMGEVSMAFSHNVFADTYAEMASELLFVARRLFGWSDDEIAARMHQASVEGGDEEGRVIRTLLKDALRSLKNPPRPDDGVADAHRMWVTLLIETVLGAVHLDDEKQRLHQAREDKKQREDTDAK